MLDKYIQVVESSENKGIIIIIIIIICMFHYDTTNEGKTCEKAKDSRGLPKVRTERRVTQTIKNINVC